MIHVCGFPKHTVVACRDCGVEKEEAVMGTIKDIVTGKRAYLCASCYRKKVHD